MSTSPASASSAVPEVTLPSITKVSGLAATIPAGLVVQARHLMYSAALAPIFQKQPRWFQWLGPYALIDQMFALAATRTHESPDDFRSYYLGAGAVYVVGWNSATAIGLLIGPVVPESWQLGFAIPLMFVVLLISGINRWPKAVAAVAAGAVTYLAASLPNRLGLILGGVVGVAAGVAVSRLDR